MWRRNALRFGNNAQENQDSDQSISEEEEGVEDEWTGNMISLGGVGDNKGGMHVLSQLEILRDSYELHSTEKESLSSHERKGGYHIDDEVENPLFNDGDGSSCPGIASPTHTHPNEGVVYLPTVASISHSDEEIISDDEKINSPPLRSARENVDGTWSEASQEVRALVWLNENSGCSSSQGIVMKEKKSSKGGGSRTKAKPKFLFHSHSSKKDRSLVVSDRNGMTSSDNIALPVEIGAAANKDVDKFLADSELIYPEKECKQPEKHIVPSELAHEHDFKEHSMAEFLDCFQERNDLLQGISELEIKKRGRRVQMVLKRNISSLGDRNLDDDDLPDVDSRLPFHSSDEEDAQSLKSIIPRRTMAEQFHEAFGTVSVIDESPHLAFPRPLCSGIYGKLQQLIQSEKERDMDYLKNISAETDFNDEKMCISVRILSRSLEAKLIVCSCTSFEEEKKSNWENNFQQRRKDVRRTLTIIFNPRMCSDVELEVGNLIRIQPPWKAVQVKGKDEVIFLCSYFSQVQP